MESKYRARKVTLPSGETFDSTKEYRRWCELSLMQRAGAIKDLERQVKYVLIPPQRGSDGHLLEREVSYHADFKYFDNELQRLVVEDTKGFRTKEYIIKRKLMLYVHGIKVVEI